MNTTHTSRHAATYATIFIIAILLFACGESAHADMLVSPKEAESDITPVRDVETTAHLYQNGIAVFVVNFTLKALGGEAYVPAVVSHGSSEDTISYVIEDGDRNPVSEGFSAGMLLSNSAEKNANGYILEKDVRHPFTLIAVYQNFNATDEYRLRVEDIPLTFGDGSKAILTDAELQDLVTDFVSILP